MNPRWLMIAPSVWLMALTIGATTFSSAPGLRTVRFYGTTLKIPMAWHKAGSSDGDGVSVQVYQGPHGQTMDVTRLPLPGLSDFPWLPLPATDGSTLGHPYASQRTGSIPPRNGIPGAFWYQGARESATAVYQLAINAPLRQRGLVRAIIRSWSLNDRIDATKAMARLAPHSPLAKSMAWQGDRGWLLVTGDSAIGSAPSYLYRTLDHGATWHVVAATPWTHPFPNQSSAIAMAFVNQANGFIIQISYAGPTVSIYQSHDGGIHWAQEIVKLPKTPTQILHTTFSQTGLDRIALLAQGRPLYLRSVDGGIHWEVHRNP
jgi:hypothetical protein